MNDKKGRLQMPNRSLRGIFLTCLLLVVSGVLLGKYVPVWASNIPVMSKDGHIQVYLNGLELNSVLYISANDLADILWARQYCSAEKKKMDLKFGGHLVTLTLLNPIVVIDRKAFNMPLSTVYQDGAVWIPIKSFCDILAHAELSWLNWDDEKKELHVISPGLNVTGISIESKSNGTLITIPTTETFTIEHSLGPSNWLNITILGGRLDPEAFNVSTKEGLVKKVKAYQFGESSQISLQLTGLPSNYKVYQREEPLEIVVLLRQNQGHVSSSSKSNVPHQDLRPNQALAIFDLIALDAGHGGKDPGAVGPTGLKEKDVVLDVTKRLANLLQNRLGVKVILTRDDDTYVSLQRRSEIANSTGADLFISIHANAARRRSSSGFETFFLSPAKNDEARAVAMLENAALKFEEEIGLMTAELSDEDFILRDIVSDMLQSSFLKESQDLAGTIQTDMARKLDIKNRGVDQAGFFVLAGAKMPSVLIEIAFISNKYEEKLLKQRWFRQKIAEAIFDGIKRFKTKYESKL